MLGSTSKKNVYILVYDLCESEVNKQNGGRM